MVIDPELVEEQKGKSTSQELVVPKLVSFKPISAASQAAFRNELQGRLVEMHQPSTSTANDDGMKILHIFLVLYIRKLLYNRHKCKS